MKGLIKEIDWRGRILSSLRKPKAYSENDRQLEIERKIRYCCIILFIWRIGKRNLFGEGLNWKGEIGGCF